MEKGKCTLYTTLLWSV